MKKKQVSSAILVSYILIFLVITIINLIRQKDYWIDSLTAVIGCIVIFGLHYKYPVHPVIAILEGLIFVPNQLGFTFLYNMPSLNYHGDWIIHFVASLITAIVFMYYTKKITSIKEKIMLMAIISFALTMTGGTIVELMEYWGFIFFGFGNSYLGFGKGDNSQNFGPWENASLDMTFNFCGAIVGLIIYSLYIKKKVLKIKNL